MSKVPEMQSDLAGKRAALEEMKERRRALGADRDVFAMDLARAQTARGEALLDGDEDGAVRALSDLGFAKQSGDDNQFQLTVLNARLLTLAGEIADLEVGWRKTNLAEAEEALRDASRINGEPVSLYRDLRNPSFDVEESRQRWEDYHAAQKRMQDALDEVGRGNNGPREYVIEHLLRD